MYQLDNIKEINLEFFKNIFRELEELYLASQGFLLKYYYKYTKRNFGIYPYSRIWEYPWAIINANIIKGLNVLDAGCGSSPLLLYLYKRGCNCFGIDNKLYYEKKYPITFKVKIIRKLSNYFPFYYLANPHGMEPLIDIGKTLAYKINYIKADIKNLPFKDNFFDRIFCISVLEHIKRENFSYIAKEFRRVLKKNGLLAVTIDIRENGIFWRDFIKATELHILKSNELNKEDYLDLSYSIIGFILKKI